MPEPSNIMQLYTYWAMDQFVPLRDQIQLQNTARHNPPETKNTPLVTPTINFEVFASKKMYSHSWLVNNSPVLDKPQS